MPIAPKACITLSMTSQAIFVFTGGAPSVNVGDSVQVTGTVDEFSGSGGVFNMPSTQLQPSNIAFVSAGNALPAAVEITAAMLGAGSLPDVLEHLEGMRVTVASGKIVAQSPGDTNEDAVTSNDLNGEFEIVVAGVQRPLREAGISIFDPFSPVPVTVPLFDANQERLKVYPLVIPPGGTPKSGQSRWIDIYEGDQLDETQMSDWLRQAAALPGWTP